MDTRARVTPGKQVNLLQLDQELGSPGLCRNESTGEIVANGDVTTSQLSAAVAAHTPLPATPPRAPSAGCFPTTIDLYGPEPRASHALTQAQPTNGWVFPGDALSSSTTLWLMDRLPWRRVRFARWLLVWAPRDAANGMRLIQMDSGPTNIATIATLTGQSAGTPIVSTATVTDALNTLIAAGSQKQLAHQITSGATSPVIYLSRIEVLWE